MKYDSFKAFPYPVLRPCSDDFGEADFQTNHSYVYDKDRNEIDFNISYDLSSEEIQDQIELGNAEFVALIACRDTYFREKFHTNGSEITASISAEILRGEVSILCYIVAIKEINGFSSEDISAEFGAKTFDYVKGHVLAQDETISFYIDRDLFRPVSTVFQLVKKDSITSAKWELNFEEDFAQIAVSPKMKEQIDLARNNKVKRVVLLNSLWFSAVMQAIQHLKDSDEYDNLKWAKVIRHQTHNLGLSIDSDEAYLIAEELLKMPLALMEAYVFKDSEL